MLKLYSWLAWKTRILRSLLYYNDVSIMLYILHLCWFTLADAGWWVRGGFWRRGQPLADVIFSIKIVPVCCGSEYILSVRPIVHRYLLTLYCVLARSRRGSGKVWVTLWFRKILLYVLVAKIWKTGWMVSKVWLWRWYPAFIGLVIHKASLCSRSSRITSGCAPSFSRGRHWLTVKI